MRALPLPQCECIAENAAAGDAEKADEKEEGGHRRKRKRVAGHHRPRGKQKQSCVRRVYHTFSCRCTAYSVGSRSYGADSDFGIRLPWVPPRSNPCLCAGGDQSVYVYVV